MLREAAIAPINESEASAEVTEIFEDIKRQLDVPKVPLLFRYMAHIPLYLSTSWERFQFAFTRDGKLDRRTKWMLALAVSATNNNKPMILESTHRLKQFGTNDEEIAELMAVVDVANGLNKVLKAAQVNYGD